jgi:hypothetical protein
LRDVAASSFKGGKLPDCRSECPAGSWKPAAKVKPAVHRLLSSQLFNATIVAANEEGASSGTSFPVGQINVLPGAVVASNSTSTDGGLLLSVKQTASSVVQSWEAPAELNDFVPMSSAVTLETDRTVEIDARHMNQGIELDLCLALPPSDNIDAVCDQVLKRLAPFFVAGLMWDDQAGALIDVSINTTTHSAVANKLQQMAGGCTRGSVADCSCSCLFVTKHLTSFIVADVGQELQGEETAEFESSTRFNAQVKAEAEASSGQTYDNSEVAQIGDSADGSGSRAGNAGAIAGSVVGVLVLVVVAVAAVIFRRRTLAKRHGHTTTFNRGAQDGTTAIGESTSSGDDVVVSVATNPMNEYADEAASGDPNDQVAEI